MDYRIEHDTMGEVKVPADKYWGAQTERSFENFKIGSTKMPLEIIHAFGVLKKAAALANWSLGMIDAQRAELIAGVCDELISGKLDEHFPLVVYQTGSGTQSNMNVNEVVANRGNEITGEKLLHPNDHVNKSQSSNDTFPTAMHIAAVVSVEDKLLPALTELRDTLQNLEVTYTDLVKTGRTHLQDATPLTLGQEISGWRSMLNHCLVMIGGALSGLRELALGGTAVGTGLNAHHDFGRASAVSYTHLEIPTKWEVDDYVAMAYHMYPAEPAGQDRISCYRTVEDNFMREFLGHHKYGLCISYMSHPQVIGSPGRILILDHLLAEITARQDVWIATGSEIADWYRGNHQKEEEK